jgi:hypothetical protein
VVPRRGRASPYRAATRCPAADLPRLPARPLCRQLATARHHCRATDDP